MPAIDDWTPILTDPIVLVVAAVLALVIYRVSGARKRLLRKRRAALRRQASLAETPRERRELMVQWSELGGLRDYQRVTKQRDARAEGQKARAAGRPLSANPYSHALWGNGRLWRRGWQSVDRNIRWIEQHRA